MKYIYALSSVLVAILVSLPAYTSAPVPEFKVALLGDTGAGKGFGKVLELVMEEDVDLIMINGDLGYDSKAGAWEDRLLSVVDPNKVMILASLGNHDVEEGQAQGYVDIIQSFRTQKNQLGQFCSGTKRLAGNDDITAVNEVCRFGNVTVIASAVGQKALDRSGRYYENALEEKLESAPEDDWKLVGYHYTLRSMNPGIKKTQATHKFFDLIREYGAIGAQGHTHSAMASCPIVSSFVEKGPVVCHPDFNDLNKRFIAPGVGMYVDSSMGGKDIRKRKRCKKVGEEGCGHLVDLITKKGYTRVDGYKNKKANKDGAMFITFNAGGDPKKAHTYFKNIERKTIFQFDIER